MKIVIAGDFCPQNRVAELIDNGLYQSVFGKLSLEILASDYSLVNMECPVVVGDGNPITKQGPNLKCTNNSIQALKLVGFNCVTLANNHFRDYGDDGCNNTISELDKSNIDHVGGGANLDEAQEILYKEICEKKVAIVNFCEHEFSIASKNHAGSAPLDLIKNYQQIQEAKRSSDYVIVIVHGGHEYYQLPSPRMKKSYRWFTEIGADVVINHHQHCYSGYEVYNGKPIFYGLGNFCFDGNRSGKDLWYEGYMVELDSSICPNGFRLIPYTQCEETPSVIPMNGDKLNVFYDNVNRLNNIIQDDEKLQLEFDKWCKKRAEIMRLMLTPYTKRLCTGLWRRNFLPSFLPQKRILQILNMTECESHRDTFYAFLKDRL